jgi:hypothetical protein
MSFLGRIMVTLIVINNKIHIIEGRVNTRMNIGEIKLARYKTNAKHTLKMP